MYEYIKIDADPFTLGQRIAEHLWWPLVSRNGGYGQWDKPLSEPLKKHQFRPGIHASNQSLTIYGLDWFVVWYMHNGHLDGVGITGSPDQSLVTAIAASKSDALNEGYVAAKDFLARHPEFRKHPPGPKTTKKAPASEYRMP